MRQALPGKLNVTFAGAEANVAASVAYMGGQAAFVSALPNHDIADACVTTLKGLQVDTSHIIRTDRGRMGLYFLETGSNQRPSKIIYDRQGSSLALTPPTDYPWQKIFHDASWFHISGITPALSELAAQATLTAVQEAKKANVTVSCDLNFRKKLWRWGTKASPRELAENTMRQILPFPGKR